jgi:hypothetical protein
LKAVVVAYIVRISYVVSLLGSLGLNNFPLRDALMDVAFGEVDSNGCHQVWGETEGGCFQLCMMRTSMVMYQVKASQLERLFVPITVAILALVCLLAVSVSSIWVVIGYVGSVSATGVRVQQV